jgi:hypothetical protein
LRDGITAYDYAQLTGSAGISRFPIVFTTSVSETFSVTVTAGTAQFQPLAVTLTSTAATTETLQAITCHVPASLTVNVSTPEETPVQGADVRMTDQRTSNYYAGRTDETGAVRFEELYAGQYVIETVAEGLNFKEVSVSLAGGDEQTVDQIAYKPTDLPVGPEPGSEAFRLFLPAVSLGQGTEQ